MRALISAMAMAKGRKPRPHRGVTIPLQSRVPEAVHRRAHRAAEQLGISVSAYLEELILRDPVDDKGRPQWDPPASLTGSQPIPGLEQLSA